MLQNGLWCANSWILLESITGTYRENNNYLRIIPHFISLDVNVL